jgi:hypothetical protein
MKKRTVGVSVAVLVLLICGTVWAVRSRAADAQVEKLREMGREAFDGPRDSEKSGEFREAMKGLSHEQRREVMGSLFEERENNRIAKFFALPPAQQTAFLDEEIKKEEERRQQWEARRNQADQSQGQGGPSAQPPGPPGAARNAGPQGRQPKTLDDRLLRRNKRLDRTTPEQRSQRTAFRAAMDKRRKELGLPTFPGRR